MCWPRVPPEPDPSSEEAALPCRTCLLHTTRLPTQVNSHQPLLPRWVCNVFAVAGNCFKILNSHISTVTSILSLSICLLNLAFTEAHFYRLLFYSGGFFFFFYPSCLLFTFCSASSPPRHLFLQGCSFKGKTKANFTSLLKFGYAQKKQLSANVIEIQICGVFLVFVCALFWFCCLLYIQHTVLILHSWFVAFNHWCLMYTIMLRASSDVSASSISPLCLVDL